MERIGNPAFSMEYMVYSVKELPLNTFDKNNRRLDKTFYLKVEKEAQVFFKSEFLNLDLFFKIITLSVKF